MEQLEGRVAVVTGAASGIGRGLAHAFADAGMSVVVADVDRAGASSVAAELVAAGHHAVGHRADVTDPESIAALARAALDAFGAVHVLANNAGVMPVGPLAEASEHDWTWTFDVNVRGVVRCVQAFLPHLSASTPAHIVNTASMAGLAPRVTSNLGVYSASKAAVVVYSEVLRAELASLGIGVSVLCPGPVSTRIWESERNRPAHLGETRSVSAPERASTGLDPLEVGRMVVEAVRHDRPYIFTNAGSKGRIDRRIAGLQEALGIVES